MGAVILSVSVPVVLSIVLPIVTLIAGFVVGFAIYHFVLKNKTDRSKKFANKMVEEAIAEAKNFVHSSLEHNAVWRVVNKLKNDGIADFDIADYDADDDTCVSNFVRLIRKNTSLPRSSWSTTVCGGWTT